MVPNISLDDIFSTTFRIRYPLLSGHQSVPPPPPQRHKIQATRFLFPVSDDILFICVVVESRTKN